RKETLAVRRDVIHALAVGLDRADVALIFQKLQGGVNGAGGGSVTTPHLFLERLDQFVSVPRLLPQQVQDHEFHVPGFEDLGPATPTTRPGPASPTWPPITPSEFRSKEVAETPIVAMSPHMTSAMSCATFYDIS